LSGIRLCDYCRTRMTEIKPGDVFVCEHCYPLLKDYIRIEENSKQVRDQDRTPAQES
jgi:hypothetical protein